MGSIREGGSVKKKSMFVNATEKYYFQLKFTRSFFLIHTFFFKSLLLHVCSALAEVTFRLKASSEDVSHLSHSVISLGF